MLPEEERQAFGRLSVFAGGFTLEAAEAVCGSDEGNVTAVLDLVARLVDKSVLATVSPSRRSLQDAGDDSPVRA